MLRSLVGSEMCIRDRLYHDLSPGLKVFTGGSKDNLVVGSGPVIFLGDELVHEEMSHLSPQCSVFQAELQATFMEDKYFKERPPEEAYYIFSDSRQNFWYFEWIRCHSN